MPFHRVVAPLLERLVDDAAACPPTSAPVADALAAHAAHRDAWYADLIGPLLVPASRLPELRDPPEPLDPPPAVAVVGDTGLAGVAEAFAAAAATPQCVQFEVAVAKRGEDPQPGVRTVLAEAALGPGLDVYTELPLTWGLLDALDLIATERAAGVRVAPKFRVDGLAAELFPTPVELAAVICACRDRGLPFKLTAGAHQALRHTDPETGLTHHGFLNILAGCLVADDGAEPADVAELLGAVDPLPVVEVVRSRLAGRRPWWVGFGSCEVTGPVADLATLGLLGGATR